MRLFFDIKGKRKIIVLAVLIFAASLALPRLSWAYSGEGGVCRCGDETDAANGGFGGSATDACEDCSAALGDDKNCKNQVNYAGVVVITNHKGTCINNPKGFGGKTFDCQGNTIAGDGVTGVWPDAAFYVSGQTGFAVKNCLISRFERGIFIDQKDWMERAGNPIASTRSWADTVLDAPAFIRKDGKTIYLYLEGYSGGSFGEMFGLLRSTDDGESWTFVKGGDPLPDFVDTSQPWSSRGDEACPAPVKVGETIYMFYASRPAHGAWGWNVGVATSTDWVHFKPDNKNSPLVKRGGHGTWDETAVFHTSKPILKGDTWFIFYTGRNSSDEYGIGYLTTSKGRFPGGWVKKSVREPLWKTSTQGRPKVVKIDGTYWIYYSNGGLKRRGGSDLVHWDREESVSSRSPLFDADILKTKSHGWILASASMRWHEGKFEIGIWEGSRFNLVGNTIQDCPFGIYLDSFGGGTIEGNTICSNGVGLYLGGDSTGGTVRGNTICLSKEYDIKGGGGGLDTNNTCDKVAALGDDVGGCTRNCDKASCPSSCGCWILGIIPICGVGGLFCLVIAWVAPLSLAGGLFIWWFLRRYRTKKLAGSFVSDKLT